MVHELGQSGTLFENEKRVAFGYDPLPELVGVRLQSLNYVNVNIADLKQSEGVTGQPQPDEPAEEETEE